jgi:hypothetical protein
MTKINLALPENGDEVAVSIAPTSERAEECLKVLSAVESRMANSEAMTESDRQAAIAAIGNLRRFFSESRAKAHYQIQKIKMPLDQKDLEQIERIIYKNGDDVAVASARAFERLEERMDAMESRIYSRFADIETTVEGSRQDVIDGIGILKELVNELIEDNQSQH